MGTALSGDPVGHYRDLSYWLSTLDGPLTLVPHCRATRTLTW